MNTFCSTPRVIFAWLLLVFMIAGLAPAQAQVQVPFSPRTAAASPEKTIYSIKGDFTMIGNTNLQTEDPDATTNNTSMVYVDIDGDPTTLNSSSATLLFSQENGADPSCSEVVYAGLYWTGRASAGPESPISFEVSKDGLTKTLNKRQVLFKHANGSYQTITAAPNNIYFPETSESLMYSAYAEVTDLVKEHGGGEYFVADMALNEGSDEQVGFYGGWGLVVVYQNSKMNWRDVTVFDGHAYVTGSQVLEYQIPIEGFQTAQNGEVNIKLGVMAGEGDMDLDGNYLEIENGLNSGEFIRLSHEGNSPDNFFNSSIFTGGNPRNPFLKHNAGMDISMFEIPNENNEVIGNSQTSTLFRYGSVRDRYIIFNLTFSVDAYVPEVVGINKVSRINGQEVTEENAEVEPGEEIEFTIELFNKGTEPIEDAQIVIPLPFTATQATVEEQLFFSGHNSSGATYEPTMGPNGSIVWKVGDLPMPSSIGEASDFVLARLSYTVKATEDCFILTNEECNPSISIEGAISGTGKVSGTPFKEISLIQGYQDGGECKGEMVTGPVVVWVNTENFDATQCKDYSQNRVFEFCLAEGEEIPFDLIKDAFPAGIRFYKEIPGLNVELMEFDANNPFPTESDTYYALPVGMDHEVCAFAFEIKVNEVAPPKVKNRVVDIDFGTTTYIVEASPNHTLVWYDFRGNKLDEEPVVQLWFPGVHTAYVSQVNEAGCESEKVPVVVKVLAGFALSLTKVADRAVFSEAGQEINYVIEIDNDGDFAANNVKVEDPLTGLETIVAEVPPFSKYHVYTSYTVTAADVEAGKVRNTAFAVTVDAGGVEFALEASALVTYRAGEGPPPGDNPTIIANDDHFGDFEAKVGGLLGNILDNDLLNGQKVKPEQIDFIFTDLDGLLGLIIGEDGKLRLMGGVAEARAYTLEYELWELGNPQNRDKAIVTFQLLSGDPEVDFTKSVDRTEVMVGDMVTYTISLTNNGNQTLENIRIEDFLPEELMYISSNFDREDDDSLVFIIAQLPAGETVELVIEAMATAEGEVVNKAQLTIGDFEKEAESESVIVKNAQVDLAISKTSFNRDIVEGDAFEYEIEVINIGSETAHAVIITDRLPSKVTYLGYSFEADFDAEISVQVSGQQVQWQVERFPAGGTLTLTLEVKANNKGTIINEVEVSSREEDVDLSNNKARDENEIKEVFFPNVITPGGDGKNDFFVIKGLDKFVQNDLTIFNRYGDHIYEATNYQNNWGAPGLNSGTYYYVMKSTDSNGQQTIFKGWIQVIKDGNGKDF
ncbi:DUF11 domain-containing protein [Litoribacter alkaliphilus]|uniref:DUF11 domain-containing protein n=1 Tax=Litoribacter ruber TaxID=702568 RepID=A0AAP2G158_9BACT|nr:gliding motility-associated C-terminal domain-containing protein [Litoribacter alkaliphilus]MBS9523582.1 DUF11 domain-containing protein [Litoribacter alkaliphilus]